MGVRIREKVKGSGIWWVFINHEGKRTSRQIGRRNAAEVAAEKIEAKLKLGQTALPKKEKRCPTLCEWYESYRTRILVGLREATRRGYATSFKRILPAFGKTSLDQITKFKVQEFVAGLMRENLSRSTIRVICANLCTVLNDAVDHEQIPQNPALKLGKIYKNARKPKKVEPFDAAEVIRILQATSRLYPDLYPALLFVMHTGVRSGEVAGVCWDDIDFDAHQINISGAVSRYERHKGETKTDTERKPIDMSEELETELKAQRKRLQTMYLKRGSNEIPRWVFPNRSGGPFDIENRKKRDWGRILEAAGLSHRPFHQTRHTVACLLLMNGQSLIYVRDLLGHASIRVTSDIYAKWIKSSNREAVNCLPTIRAEVQGKVVGR